MQVIEKVRDDLAYRLPGGEQLHVVILSREQAEQLVADWDELIKEGPSMSERAVLWIVAATLALAILVILTISYSRSAEQMVACSSYKRSNAYWSWREIDGRRCWYEGRAGKSKTLLHWPRMPPPQDAMPVAVGQPGVNRPDPGPASTEEQRALTPEEEELLTTYWPNLAELEAMEIGIRPLPPFEPLRFVSPKPQQSSWSWLWIFLVPLGYLSFVMARSKWRERKVGLR